MKIIIILSLSLLSLISWAQDASTILIRTREAYGGPAWDTVHYIHFHTIGHTQWIEQSENPNGPFVLSYEDTEETRGADKLYQKVETKMMQSKTPFATQTIVNGNSGMIQYGENAIPLSYSQWQEKRNWLNYGPEHLMKLAERNPATLKKEVIIEGVPHFQISFEDQAIPYILLINKHTYLISEARISTYLPGDFFFSLWGNLITTIKYTAYSLEKRNILYPLQWDIYRIGQSW